MRAILQLMRFPAVFTAMADILLGASMVSVVGGRWGDHVPYSRLALLLLASATLYLAGMTFNDVFDVEEDRRERPMRPIPSGRVRLRTAVMLGILLTGAGLLAAGLAGACSLVVSVLLVVCILLYDGVLKSTIAGPVAMAACRFGNVVLGATAASHEFFPQLVQQPQLVYTVASGTACYVLGVTLFARQEAETSSPGQLTLALAVVNAALGGLAWCLWAEAVTVSRAAPRAALLLLIVMFFVTRRAIWAIAKPEAARVQSCVRSMLLTIVTIDAVLVFGLTGHVPLAVLTVGLIVPAVFVGRWLYVT